MYNLYTTEHSTVFFCLAVGDFTHWNFAQKLPCNEWMAWNEVKWYWMVWICVATWKSAIFHVSDDEYSLHFETTSSAFRVILLYSMESYRHWHMLHSTLNLPRPFIFLFFSFLFRRWQTEVNSKCTTRAPVQLTQVSMKSVCPLKVSDFRRSEFYFWKTKLYYFVSSFSEADDERNNENPIRMQIFEAIIKLYVAVVIMVHRHNGNELFFFNHVVFRVEVEVDRIYWPLTIKTKPFIFHFGGFSFLTFSYS